MANLDQFTSEDKFLMLALDHRGSFKKLINPDYPEAVTGEQAVQLKAEIISALEDQFSGLLIDTDYGLPAYQSKAKPYLLPVEKSGYTDQGGERVTELEYSVGQLVNLGASGAKLLLYFNPNLQSATKQLEVGRKVWEECQRYNFPIFIEIVTYVPENLRLHLEGGSTNIVAESVERFITAGIVPEVWKLEYPGSFKACQEVTEIAGDTPWILLTRGDTFDTFKRELEDAMASGAKGFLAGRALWQEVCRMEGEEKGKFLRETLPQRFRAIAEIAKRG